MASRRAPALFLILFSISGTVACRPKNVRIVRVGSLDVREIRIVSRAGTMAADVLAVVDRRGRLILPPLSAELAEISDVCVSPDRDLVLVVSVGEGHPWINVYRLSDWLGPERTGEAIRPLKSMDPYPYSWTGTAWSGRRSIRFSSAGDYGRFDVRTRRPGDAVSADAPAKDWIWDLDTDAVTPAGRR
jgi:hypothetical protein